MHTHTAHPPRPVMLHADHAPAHAAVQNIAALAGPRATIKADHITHNSSQKTEFYKLVSAQLKIDDNPTHPLSKAKTTQSSSRDVSPERPQFSLSRLLTPTRITNYYHEFRRGDQFGTLGTLLVRPKDIPNVTAAFRSLFKTEPIAADYLYLLQSDPFRKYTILVNHEQMTTYDRSSREIHWDPTVMAFNVQTGERYSPAMNLLHTISLAVTEPHEHPISEKAMQRYCENADAFKDFNFKEISIPVRAVDSTRPHYTWRLNGVAFSASENDIFHGHISAPTDDETPHLSIRLQNGSALQIPIEDTFLVFRGDPAFRHQDFMKILKTVNHLEEKRVGLTASIDHEGFFHLVLDPQTQGSKVRRHHNFAWQHQASPLRSVTQAPSSRV